MLSLRSDLALVHVSDGLENGRAVRTQIDGSLALVIERGQIYGLPALQQEGYQVQIRLEDRVVQDSSTIFAPEAVEIEKVAGRCLHRRLSLVL